MAKLIRRNLLSFSTNVLKLAYRDVDIFSGVTLRFNGGEGTTGGKGWEGRNQE